MKLANKLLSHIKPVTNEDLEAANKAATDSLKKDIGKDVYDIMGRKEGDNFLSALVQIAFDFGEMDSIVSAMRKAVKLHSKAAEIEERAQNQNIKVRGVTEGFGSRKARLTIKESVRMIEQMLDDNAGAPYPKAEVDEVYLKEAKHIANEAMKKLRIVKDSKVKRKK